MKIIVVNSFSLSMLDRESQKVAPGSHPRIPRPLSDPNQWLRDCRLLSGGDFTLTSAIGHADTARLLSGLLGVELPMNRMSVKLPARRGNEVPETLLLVGQYTGPRLPEGTTALPEGAAFEWWIL